MFQPGFDRLYLLAISRSGPQLDNALSRASWYGDIEWYGNCHIVAPRVCHGEVANCINNFPGGLQLKRHHIVVAESRLEYILQVIANIPYEGGGRFYRKDLKHRYPDGREEKVDKIWLGYITAMPSCSFDTTAATWVNDSSQNVSAHGVDRPLAVSSGVTNTRSSDAVQNVSSDGVARPLAESSGVTNARSSDAAQNVSPDGVDEPLAELSGLAGTWAAAAARLQCAGRTPTAVRRLGLLPPRRRQCQAAAKLISNWWRAQWVRFRADAIALLFTLNTVAICCVFFAAEDVRNFGVGVYQGFLSEGPDRNDLRRMTHMSVYLLQVGAVTVENNLINSCMDQGAVPWFRFKLLLSVAVNALQGRMSRLPTGNRLLSWTNDACTHSDADRIFQMSFMFFLKDFERDMKQYASQAIIQKRVSVEVLARLLCLAVFRVVQNLRFRYGGRYPCGSEETLKWLLALHFTHISNVSECMDNEFRRGLAVCAAIQLARNGVQLWSLDRTLAEDHTELLDVPLSEWMVGLDTLRREYQNRSGPAWYDNPGLMSQPELSWSLRPSVGTWLMLPPLCMRA